MKQGGSVLREPARQRHILTYAMPGGDPAEVSLAPASTVVGVNAAPPGAWAAPARSTYLIALTWAFTFFNSVRVLSYLPTLWTIHAAADSSQYSLWTRGTWLGANATMAAWLYEHNGCRFDRAVALNTGNAIMCVASVVIIAWYRL